MQRFISPRTLLLAACLCGGATQAHVVLPPGSATAGSTYVAAFKIGHPCKGARFTKQLTVHLPPGFAFVSAESRPGWTVAAIPGQVSWTAASKEATDGAPGSFTVVGKLGSTPGTLWFPTLQTCDVGASDWSALPTAAQPKPEFPAPHLDVVTAVAMPAAAVEMRDAWVRPTVPGQTSSGLFGRLRAPAGARLVGVSTPLGHAALHEMKMDGDVMRMREVEGGLDLPAGHTVDLAPGGWHVMLTGLTQPLVAGGTLPLTLNFVDRDGQQGELRLQVPISAVPPPASPVR